MNVRGQAFGNRDFLDDTPDAASGQMAATLVDQQCRSIFLASEDTLAHWKIGSQGFLDRFTERNVALFFPFAANQNGFGAQSYVIELDAGQLRIADAAAIQQLKYQAIALRKSCSI